MKRKIILLLLVLVVAFSATASAKPDNQRRPDQRHRVEKEEKEQRNGQQRQEQRNGQQRQEQRNGQQRQEQRNDQQRQEQRNGQQRQEQRNGQQRQEQRNGQQRQEQRNGQQRQEQRNGQHERDHRQNESIERKAPPKKWDHPSYNSHSWRQTRHSALPFTWHQHRNRIYQPGHIIERIYDHGWTSRFPGLYPYRWHARNGAGFWYQGRHITDAIMFYDSFDRLVSVGFMHNGIFMFIRDDNCGFENRDSFFLGWRW